MEYEKICRVLQRAGRTRIKRASGSKFVYANCPMAPYSGLHKSNNDSSPSFYVTISSPSFCGCWVCGFEKPKGKTFARLLEELTAESPVFKEAYELAMHPTYDGNNLHKRDSGFAPGFKVDRLVYTGYDERFRTDMDVMPWNWLDTKGVHEKGVETFRIGVDVGSGSVVLPSIDRDGQVVGAQARSIYQGSDTDSKYVSILKFSSGENFFGEHLLTDEPNTVVLFEGPFDAVHAWEEGVENVLAVYGKALRDGQILKLKKWGIQYCFLLLDPDKAGQAGIAESKELVEKLYPEMVVYAPKLPCDPKQMTSNQFRAVLEQENNQCLTKVTVESLDRALKKLTSPSATKRRR